MSKWMESKVRAVKALPKHLKKLWGLLRRKLSRLKPKSRRQVWIDIEGPTIRFLCEDAPDFLFENGDFKIWRAGHIEPVNVNGVVMWTVDLRPAGGEVHEHFYSRAGAIEFERAWLKKNLRKDSDANRRAG